MKAATQMEALTASEITLSQELSAKGASREDIEKAILGRRQLKSAGKLNLVSLPSFKVGADGVVTVANQIPSSEEVDADKERNHDALNAVGWSS